MNSDEISCQLPPGEPSSGGEPVEVSVARGNLPELRGTFRYLSYQGFPAQMAMPQVSNIAAHSLDLTWEPPTFEEARFSASPLRVMWHTTGYVVSYRIEAEKDARKGELQDKNRFLEGIAHEVTFGNITSTTILGLEPASSYVFAVAAVVEDRFGDQTFLDTVDIYGRRRLLPGALIGPKSVYCNAAATL